MMYKNYKIMLRLFQKTVQNQRRRISALYITGDKAKENYVVLQPFMDYEATLGDRPTLEFSITKRNMKTNLDSIYQKYETFSAVRKNIQQLEKQREDLATKIKTLAKDNNTPSIDLDALKEQGKSLRTYLKTLKEGFYPTEDDFAHEFLNLPNGLHKNCPCDGNEKLLFRKLRENLEKAESHLKESNLIRFVDNSRYYLMAEAAEFDLDATQAMTRHFVHKGKFLQSANPDFVRCVLLEANATPLDRYHMVMEEHLQNKLNAAYLTGGAAFESFLGAVTKLSVYSSMLPLCFVACGRSYQRSTTDGVQSEANLFTATQTNCVQTFVAAPDALEAEQQMDAILNLAVDFYQSLGLQFRIVYVDASALTPAESLRASIEVYSPAQERYIAVGSVSNFGDFVSKRILFTARQQKDSIFPHLVGGPVLYTTRLIAAMIEQRLELRSVALPGAHLSKDAVQSSVDEFKRIFK